MNDHVLFLTFAYVLSAICMMWEVAALMLRRRSAMRKMRIAMEENE